MANLKPTARVTGAFTKYCQKVIPLYFDESMSYYEQLCAFTEKLHEVINVVNANGDSVEELQNLYIELKNYVDNYFKNLDVQTEINNKLDEMASSGKLEEIIGKYLDSTAIFGFTNVNEMISAENLVNGSYAKTMGYYEINDGGSGLYKIRTRTTSDNVDNGSIIAMTNDTLVAELIINKKINAMNWGLNDTNFSEKINYLLETFDLPVYIPNGQYILTEPINITKDYTILTCDGDIMCSTNINMFNISASYCEITFNGSLEGNIVNNERVATAINIGNNTKSIGWNNININVINNVKNGLLFTPNNFNGVHYQKINFNYINASYGIKFKAGDDDKPWVNENTFIGGRLLGGVGIYMRKGENQIDRYNGNKFINIGYENLECAIDIDDAFYNVFDRCRMNESLQGDYWIKCGTRANINTFTLETVILDTQIQDQTPSYVNGNTYNVKLTNSSGIWLGKKFVGFQDGYVIEPGFELTSRPILINNYNRNGVIPTTNIFSQNATLVIGGDNANTTYNTILPSSIFNENAVKKINIYVGFRHSTAEVNIYDSNNNILLSNSQLPTGNLSKQWFTLEYHYSTFDSSKPWILSSTNVVNSSGEPIAPIEVLNGKHIGFIGDSICSNLGGYPLQIATKYGTINQNISRGGSTIADNTKGNEFIINEQVENINANNDMILVEGGINDYWDGVSIGECDFESNTMYTTELDTSTLAGGLEKIFRYLYANYPGKKYGFIIQHFIGDTYNKPNKNNVTYKEYYDMIIKICNKYSIPVFDILKDVNFNTSFANISSQYTTNNDRTHPTVEGYNLFYRDFIANNMKKYF